ncbi:hypothetical protein FIM12_03425 [SAR202 cluster bacterium AD-804-J14_MRT_500m]|nr:hypothetical protein [SAR202 cluster bacterium AD-804-J14_MRT_500m]
MSNNFPPSRRKEADEKYCESCGGLIKQKAEICPLCGVRQLPSPPVGQRNAGLFVLLNVFTGFIGILGIGQLINGRVAKGLFFLISGGLIYVISVVFLFLFGGLGNIIWLLLYLPLWIWSVVNVNNAVREYNNRSENTGF